MTQIGQKWQNLADRVDAMSLRERALIFLAAVLVLITLVNTLLIDPLLKRQSALSRQIVQTQTQTQALQSQIQALATANNADPDEALRARLQQLQQDLASADTALLDFQNGLVPPQQMPAMLEDILLRNRALRLVSLKTLPTQNLAAAVEEAVAQAADGETPPSRPAAPQAGVYRHGVEITLQGSYADLLRYLAAMESSPYRMFWGKAALKADTYPKATLTLTLYTLSLDKAWLAI
jgi:General secretion pathway, M protein.